MEKGPLLAIYGTSGGERVPIFEGVIFAPRHDLDKIRIGRDLI
jgi:hypothetical protein